MPTKPSPGAPVFPSPAAPGPAGSPVARLHGRYGTLRLQVTGPADVTLLLVDWEVEGQQEFADGTAHGDFWYNPIPITQRWTGRVRGYLTNSAAAAATYLHAGFNTSNVGGKLTFTGYSDVTPSGGAPGTTAIFAGTCFAARGRVLMPMAMVMQELELTGIGPPTTL